MCFEEIRNAIKIFILFNKIFRKRMQKLKREWIILKTTNNNN